MMHGSRRGFSLMEVMLATSILLGSSIALIELATIGRKHASSAYDLNTAQILCQAKMDELVAGIDSPKATEEQELLDNPGWFYSVENQPLRVKDLTEVRVSVFQEARENQKQIRFTLVRWLPAEAKDPFGETPTETEPPRSTSRSTPQPESTEQQATPFPRRRSLQREATP